MKLDPLLVRALSTFTLPHAADISSERANEVIMNRSLIERGAILPRPDSVSIVDEVIGGPDAEKPIRVRIYFPGVPSSGARAALVFAHGGGWATGSIETTDPLCGNLSADADIVVISVEYRLAPEHRFPAGIEDFYFAVCWAFSESERLGVDRARIAVGGESAGGNLAAVSCLMARDRSGPRIARQLLWAPALDATMSGPSACEFRRLLPGISQLGAQMMPRYLPPGIAADNPYVSPLLANNLSDLPDAMLFACEVDPLRDDCSRYADRLIQAGGRASWKLFPGLLHGTQSLTGILPIAREWHAESIRVLQSI